jgi:hypothetical protein
MDIGKIVKVGERTIETWQPAPTMVPVSPEKGDKPEPRREVTPEHERETVDS